MNDQGIVVQYGQIIEYDHILCEPLEIDAEIRARLETQLAEVSQAAFTQPATPEPPSTLTLERLQNTIRGAFGITPEMMGNAELEASQAIAFEESCARRGLAWQAYQRLTVSDQMVVIPGGIYRVQPDESSRRLFRFNELRAEGKKFGEINQILEQEGFSEVSGEGVMPAPTKHHQIVRENKGIKRMIEKGEL